jgi:hypothetical protein
VSEGSVLSSEEGPGELSSFSLICVCLGEVFDACGRVGHG